MATHFLSDAFKNMSFEEVKSQYYFARNLLNFFENKEFTRKDFDKIVRNDYDNFGHINNGERWYYCPTTINTYLKYNLIKVVRSESFKIYGTRDWGFEACPEMTDEIFNILPRSVQEMFEVQNRKRNFYQINFDYLRELTRAYTTLSALFED